MNRVDDSTRPLKFIEDVAVPFEKIIEFYNAEKKLLDNYGLRTAFFGHIGTGHFHINPRINTRKTGAQQKISEIGKKTYELVRSLGGTFSAEHGDGVLREPYIRELQPELYQLFYQIKDTLDPGWTLNPGKIVSKDKHEPRSRYDFTPAKKVPTILLNAVEKCHGCNDCIHFCMAKNAYARNRANIIRNIMNGTIRSKKDINDAVNYIERCHGCGKCLTECPAAVDLLNTASLLREYGVIRISTLKGFMMKLLMPLRDLLQRKLDACDNNVEFKVPRIFNPVLRLGLYYKPYTREILNIVKIKNISLAVTDNDLQRYLTLSK